MPVRGGGKDERRKEGRSGMMVRYLIYDIS